MAEQMRGDRADSGLGRPWNKGSLERAKQLDINHPIKLRDESPKETIYTCPLTHISLYLEYPASYTLSQALSEARRLDINHLHRPFETWYLHE